MVIDSVVTQLKQEVARINQAVAALEVLNRTGLRRGGASKVSQNMRASGPRHHTMNAAALAQDSRCSASAVGKTTS